MQPLFRAVLTVIMTVGLVLLGLPGTASAGVPQLLTVRPESGPAGSNVTVSGTGWLPEYYASGVRVGFHQNHGNGVLTSYADERTVQVDGNGEFSFEATIPTSFSAGDVLTFSGLIGNGSGANANFTVTDGSSSEASALADLAPTDIYYDKDAKVGTKVHFDAGVVNSGDGPAGTFNVKWYVDGREVGAYGSHDGMERRSQKRDGNSQFDWMFEKAGTYTVTFAVDVDDHVKEADESNNSSDVTVVMENEPQLACSFSPDQIPFMLAFKTACDDHDKCYMDKGGPGKSLGVKLECDNAFGAAATSSCSSQPSVSQQQCVLAAGAYYLAVAMFGEPFFHARDRAARAGTIDAILQYLAKPAE